MTPAARVQSAIDLLDAILSSARDGGAAADVIATRFFKERRYAGSGDRRAIRALAWQAIRTYGEIPANGRAAMVAMADRDADLARLFDGSAHGPAAIVDGEPRATGDVVPQWLMPLLHPLIDASECAALLDRAPLDLRVNRARLGEHSLPAGEALPPPLDGLRLPADTSVLESEAYRAGALEVQDAGSQWIAHACAAQAGMTVVDLCAGAGGKTLALAATMESQGSHGRLIACDTDRRRLSELAPRAMRAGVNWVETRLLNPRQELDQLTDLIGAADLVLIDAPCSGSGTWRRNPESRWRLTPARLARLVDEQARLLDIGAKLVAPGGAMLYAVCAITGAEGEEQVSAFLKRSGWKAEALFAEGDYMPGRVSGDGRILTPLHDGCDGFFLARMGR